MSSAVAAVAVPFQSFPCQRACGGLGCALRRQGCCASSCYSCCIKSIERARNSAFSPLPSIANHLAASSSGASAALSCECCSERQRCCFSAAALSECCEAAAAADLLELFWLSWLRRAKQPEQCRRLRRNDRAGCPPCHWELHQIIIWWRRSREQLRRRAKRRRLQLHQMGIWWLALLERASALQWHA